MHWAAKYIGIPYEPGARGPEKVDCWGLVYLVYLDIFKLQMPLYPGVSSLKPIECENTIRRALADEWVPIESPIDGCLVAMSKRETIHHVGLFADVDGGRIIHCYEAVKGVVADTRDSLRLRCMRTVKYYLHKQWPTSLKHQIPSSH